MLHKIIAMEMPTPPVILTAGFQEIMSPVPRSRAYVNFWGLKVMVSVDTIEGGDKYLHVSVSKDNRLPTWDELREVKDIFIGTDREAFQFFPFQQEYVNACKNCLHIWSCLNRDLLKK